MAGAERVLCAGTVGRSWVWGGESRPESHLCLSKREVSLLLDPAAVRVIKLSVSDKTFCDDGKVYTKEPRMAVEHLKCGWRDRGAAF